MYLFQSITRTAAVDPLHAHSDVSAFPCLFASSSLSPVCGWFCIFPSQFHSHPLAAVTLCYSHFTILSKFIVKYQVVDRILHFKSTWCARWCVARNHLGSWTALIGKGPALTHKKRKKKKKSNMFGRWLDEPSVYHSLSQTHLNQLNYMM